MLDTIHRIVFFRLHKLCGELDVSRVQSHHSEDIHEEKGSFAPPEGCSLRGLRMGFGPDVDRVADPDDLHGVVFKLSSSSSFPLDGRRLTNSEAEVYCGIKYRFLAPRREDQRSRDSQICCCHGFQKSCCWIFFLFFS